MRAPGSAANWWLGRVLAEGRLPFYGRRASREVGVWKIGLNVGGDAHGRQLYCRCISGEFVYDVDRFSCNLVNNCSTSGMSGLNGGTRF